MKIPVKLLAPIPPLFGDLEYQAQRILSKG